MANEHESIKKKKKRKRRREETPPVSADEGAAKQKGGGTAGKKRAGEEATAGPPKGKKRRRDESSEEEPEQQPSTPSTAEPGDGDGAGDGGVWRRRVRQLVQAAADAQEFAALSATLREWDQTDVAELIQDWEPGAVANLIQVRATPGELAGGAAAGQAEASALARLGEGESRTSQLAPFLCCLA